jgi:hypothetical protein
VALRSIDNLLVTLSPEPPPGALGRLWVDDNAAYPNLFQCTSLSPLTYTSITGGGGGGGVPTSRQINTNAPLSGGGDLTADRTLSVSDFTSSTRGTVPASGGGTTNFLRADGNWSPPPGGGAAAWGSITGTLSAQTDLQSALNAKANASIQINTTSPLQGGGDLSANRTLSVLAFGAAQAGVVPASGGGSTSFLRADGVWATPPGGGGSADIKEAIITVPYNGFRRQVATVVDAAVSPSSQIMVGWGAIQNTDENDPEFCDASFFAIPGTGQFDVVVYCARDIIGGTYKINYQVG